MHIQVLAVLELWAKRLDNGELTPDMVLELRRELSSKAVLPAITLRNSLVNNAALRLPGFSVLGHGLMLEDQPGMASGLHDLGGEATRGGGPPQAKRQKISRSASGGGFTGSGSGRAVALLAVGSAPAAAATAQGILSASSEAPKGSAMQRLVRVLGVPLMSQRVSRTVVEDPQPPPPPGVSGPTAAPGEHAAVCLRARAVFPIVQRFLMKVWCCICCHSGTEGMILNRDNRM